MSKTVYHLCTFCIKGNIRPRFIFAPFTLVVRMSLNNENLKTELIPKSQISCFKHNFVCVTLRPANRVQVKNWSKTHGAKKNPVYSKAERLMDKNKLFI